MKSLCMQRGVTVGQIKLKEVGQIFGYDIEKKVNLPTSLLILDE